MFEHGMAESLSDRVNIEDIDSEVLREMLRFMYIFLIKIYQKINFLKLGILEVLQILKEWLTSF